MPKPTTATFSRLVGDTADFSLDRSSSQRLSETLVLKRSMAIGRQTLTLQEAASQLGLHYMTVYRYVRTGKLPATQEGMSWRVRVQDVKALAKGRKVVAGPGARPAPHDIMQALEA